MNGAARNISSGGTVISTLPDAPVPEHLATRILGRIARLKRRGALTRAAFLGLICVLSVAGFIETLLYAADDLYLSGFSDYVGLLFSDTHIVLASWQEFALALLQSIPALPLAVACALLCIFVWSLARSVRNLMTAFTRTLV